MDFGRFNGGMGTSTLEERTGGGIGSSREGDSRYWPDTCQLLSIAEAAIV